MLEALLWLAHRGGLVAKSKNTLQVMLSGCFGTIGGLCVCVYEEQDVLNILKCTRINIGIGNTQHCMIP